MWAGLSFSWHWQPEIRPHILRKYGTYSRQRQPGNVVDYTAVKELMALSHKYGNIVP